MDKQQLNSEFSARLIEAMKKAGFNSHRSLSGVCLQTLAEITDSSLQICRKYVRGEAIPDTMKVITIAQKLDVSPGWLLFGEEGSAKQNNKLSIDVDLLRYLLNRCQGFSENQDLITFILELAQDLSQIDTNTEQSKKIIDLAISSAKHFVKADKSS